MVNFVGGFDPLCPLDERRLSRFGPNAHVVAYKRWWQLEGRHLAGPAYVERVREARRWIDSPPSPRWLSVLVWLVGAAAACLMLAFVASSPL